MRQNIFCGHYRGVVLAISVRRMLFQWPKLFATLNRHRLSKKYVYAQPLLKQFPRRLMSCLRFKISIEISSIGLTKRVQVTLRACPTVAPRSTAFTNRPYNSAGRMRRMNCPPIIKHATQRKLRRRSARSQTYTLSLSFPLIITS